MDQERLLKEAQAIAAKYPFYMVKGQLNHLYGFIYQTPDGNIKYALDVIFDESFPEEPPQIAFRQQIPNLPAEIQLNTLSNWTPNSHVVDIIDELAIIVKNAVEGTGQPTEELQNIPIQPQPPKSSQQPTQPQSSAQPQLSDQSQPPIQSQQESANVNAKANSQPLNTEEEFITPDLNAYPNVNEQWITPESYETWTEEDFEQGQQYVGENQDSQNTASTEYPDYLQSEEQADNISTTSQEYSPEEIVDTGDIILTTEAALIQQEYAMDYGESIGKVEVYLTITIDQTFIIKIDFTEYPKRPLVEVPEGIEALLGDINESLEVLKNWDPSKPPHVVDIIHELESKLWFLSDLETEANIISGEYKVEMINGVISNMKVTLYTYGFKEYQLEIDISEYPERPKIKYSLELEELIKTPLEELSAYKNWKKGESHCVDIIREIQWLVDKNSRINFELSLLRGGIKEVNYNAEENSISAKLEGKMKTEGVSFEFKVKLPKDYPMTAPKIELLSKLEGQEDLKNKLLGQIQTFTTSWHQFNYLIDLFNEISKAIFEVSVISCVICHKIECPECGLKISAPNPEDQCQVKCPSCERLYHKSCWNKTIAAFKKCGFCLRPPPPNMMYID
ncbi:MAG: hypothetical protein ACTSRZ_03985 [Promethearchaeota archaeon]